MSTKTTEQSTGLTLDKVLFIGLVPNGNLKSQLFCHVKIEDGTLSISGVIGPKPNGDADGSCGQINMGFEHGNPKHNDKRYSYLIRADQIDFAPGWSGDLWLNLLEVWHEWHLNDMKAGCQHQRQIDTTKEVTVQRWAYGDRYHELIKRTLSKHDPADLAQLKTIDGIFETIELHGYTTHGPHAWPAEAVQLLADGFIKADLKDQKSIGWIRPEEHPEGLLCKPCEVCGYKYGSAWLREELPAEVVDFLSNLPFPDCQPAWI